MNWKQQEYFNGSSVAEYKHSISQHTATTQWCIVNHCVVNVCKIQYVFRNKNNDKVNVWTFSKRDYYHLDNKWCCCYEIKCSQNRMELSAKQKYKNKTSKQQNNRQTCYTHTHTHVNGEMNFRWTMKKVFWYCKSATKWQRMSAIATIRIKVSTYIQRNYNNNL